MYSPQALVSSKCIKFWNVLFYFASSYCRLHVLARTEDNSDTGDIELIRHLHVNISSLKILLQGIVVLMTKLCVVYSTSCVLHML